MGTAFSSSGSEANDGNYSTPVILNIYDLTPLNNYTYCFGVGIFHSGIEVHGMEYGFGAHDFPTSGVFEVEPKTCPGFIYRSSITLGTLNTPPSEFRAFMENLASEYHGKGIPGWVNRLARLGAMCSCLLPESLQVTSVKQLPEYHMYSEDGSESLSINTHHEPTESDDTDPDKHLLSPSWAGEVCFLKEAHR
ncbi:hypothetical protein H6P81_001012 [Aristolochia fimbriata]|uniref:PPPDE domain-containing protein n=1 Tax=Aristolochia fimbriata TaxID=158543 RepID=A0AAV7F7B8_ARIFI|nr:hypothetical protein H6P81_001012 [Aristolochia fimbriata]